MVLGKGSTTATLTTEDVQHLLASAYDELLVIDGALDDAIESLATFFSQVEEYLNNA